MVSLQLGRSVRQYRIHYGNLIVWTSEEDQVGIAGCVRSSAKGARLVHKPMEGVRIVEVAQYTFVPASGGVLAEWGADVIKVEHAVTGDAQRGLVKLLGLDVTAKGSSFFPIMEGPNRGKRSVGIAL